MTKREEHFEAVVDETLAQIKELLLVKGKEYRRNKNPFHNFEKGAEMTGETPQKVLYGFQLKHLISISDIRNDIALGVLPKKETVIEKYNDAIVYSIIEKAMNLELIENNQNLDCIGQI